jgi:hypothetical protein
MKNKILQKSLVLLLIFAASMVYADLESIQVSPLNSARIKLFPVPADNRDYFFLQSIEKDTVIVIGDFSGLEKMVVMIIDRGSDNSIDEVVEYYPNFKKIKKGKKSDSRFFNSDIAQLKREIISGAVYNGKYADPMNSADKLELILSENDSKSVQKNVYGYEAKFFEIDETNKFAALYNFGKNAEGYYLQFRTDYLRKNYWVVEAPTLKYSVYCRASEDVVVKETVDNLIKIVAEKR